MKDTEDGFYQVIIQDSSDPFTWGENGEKIELPSSTLYSNDHFNNIQRKLSHDGIFNFQAETFNIESDLEGIVEWREQALSLGFQNARYGSISISTYPTGQIGFMLCEKSPRSASSQDEINQRFSLLMEKGNDTKYYQPKLQQR